MKGRPLLLAAAGFAAGVLVAYLADPPTIGHSDRPPLIGNPRGLITQPTPLNLRPLMVRVGDEEAAARSDPPAEGAPVAFVHIDVNGVPVVLSFAVEPVH